MIGSLNRTRVLTVLLAVALVAGISCSSPTPTPAARERLLIGTLGVFSGEAAQQNIHVIRGVELAIKQYNADPQSSYDVKLHREDTKGSADGATEAASNLAAAELLIGVVGPLSFDEAELAGPLLDQSQTPFLMPSVTNSELSGHGWISFRRLVADDRREGEAVAGEILSRTKKVALIHDGAGPGIAFVEGARAVLESAKASVRILELPQRPGKNDWKTASASVMQEPPEVVAFAGPADKAGTLITNLRAAGYKGQYYTSHASRDPAFGQAGGEATAGAFSTCVCADPSDPRLNEFSVAFRAEFSERPPPFAAEAYEGALMLLEAVEEVEPKRQTLVEFFRSSPVFRGDTKRYEFEGSGELLRPTVSLYEWQEAKWHPRGRTRPRRT